MEISKFASKPQLIEIVMDSKDLVEKYSEPITFYTWDIVNLKTYFEFFNSRSDGDFESIQLMMKKLILDKNGNAALKEDQVLPIDIASEAIKHIGDILGKSLSKPSTQTSGTQPS